MKKKILSMMLCLLTGVSYAQADNVVSAADITVPQGGEVTVELACSFETTFIGFQLDMTLDDGLSLKEEDGAPIATLGATGSNHTFANSNLGSGQYRFICTSMTNKTLPVTTVLMSVVVEADASLAVGDEKTVSVSDLKFVHKDDDNTQTELHLAPFSFKVTIGAPADTRTVLDETSTTAPTAATGVDVRVKRSIKAGQWNTICLPFDMTEAQVKVAFGSDVQLADFTSWSSEEDDSGDITAITIGFTAVTEMEANHPYIIKVSADVTEFTVDGVDIDPEEEPTVQVGKKKAERGYFTGTYVANTTVPENNLFLSGNKFWYSMGATKMKGYRGYFELADVLASVENSSAPRINMVFDEDSTTGIRDHSRGAAGNDRYYNLKGQQVEMPTKGLYIQGGKKLIVK